MDGNDLMSWKAGFGANGSAVHRQGDADADQDVDGSDFLTWQRQLGGATTIATTAVPEPATLMLLVSAALAKFFRRLFKAS